ncbi:transcriptional regulator [Nocardia sp. 852002-20019_SCH5090214]|uniref:transcriptional regulator n=1 Tax=Nocardia sp. 852002-20019_SCH5090214 TaxID=1834087 RepID=UPI0012EA9681|nr:transcriptional regulator [Nocardia sp. 852002-20019_SCH5090214]
MSPQRNEVAPEIWESPQMRRALAARDLKLVFDLLQRGGIGQRQIARMTGLHQSEVYEVIRKGRRIQAWDVLVRVADGMGIPRGYMGLAFDDPLAHSLDQAAAACTADPTEREQIKQLLSHAANVTMGTDDDTAATWWQPLDADAEPAPAPGSIGQTDIDRMTSLTAAMRTLDYQFGGGACRDAIAAQVRWSQQLLNSDGSERTHLQLRSALADMHNLAAWTSFDLGLYRSARKHFQRAHTIAHKVGDHSLAANVLYRAGRLHLHRGGEASHRNKPDSEMYRVALKFFQLGQLEAQNAGCPLTVAMLCANEAWAYALLDDRAQMQRSLGRAEDEFTRSTPDNAQAWIQFFGEADLNASFGVALTAQPSPTNADIQAGIDHLTRAISMRGPEMTRSRCFESTALGCAYLRVGATELGLQAGRQAVAAASTVRSVRTIHRLKPLYDLALDAAPEPGLHDLARSICTLQESV